VKPEPVGRTPGDAVWVGHVEHHRQHKEHDAEAQCDPGKAPIGGQQKDVFGVGWCAVTNSDPHQNHNKGAQRDYRQTKIAPVAAARGSGRLERSSWATINGCAIIAVSPIAAFMAQKIVRVIAGAIIRR